jgi:thiol-disulfide isomerase/thioredoxin
MRPVKSRTAPLIAIVLLVLCACGASPQGSSTPPAVRHYDAGSKGFAIDLQPGWTPSVQQVDGVDFANPHRRATLSVRFERAGGGLDEATRQLMLELTGQAAATPTGRTTLAGHPARTFQAATTGKGGTEWVSAAVTVQGDLAWALALAGLRSSFDSARSDFDQMTHSFRLTGPQPSPVAPAAVGQTAPDSPVLDLSHVRGPVVIYFFTSSCRPCRTEMPLLQSRALQSRGRFSLLAVDSHDNPSAVPAFLQAIGYTLPVRYDRDGSLYQVYRVLGAPATYFADAGHVIRVIQLDPLDQYTLSRSLQAIDA